MSVKPWGLRTRYLTDERGERFIAEVTVVDDEKAIEGYSPLFDTEIHDLALEVIRIARGGADVRDVS